MHVGATNLSLSNKENLISSRNVMLYLQCALCKQSSCDR